MDGLTQSIPQQQDVSGGAFVPDGHQLLGFEGIRTSPCEFQSLDTGIAHGPCYDQAASPVPIPQRDIDPAIEQQFKSLADEWHDETDHLSATFLIFASRAYREILVMPLTVPKYDVVTLMLRDLAERPGHWFEALELLTREKPGAHATSFRDSVDAWLAWGRNRGLLGRSTRRAY